jgi:hypothetical protein
MKVYKALHFPNNNDRTYHVAQPTNCKIYPLRENEGYQPIRCIYLKNGTCVHCCMNRVSPNIQALLGFFCLYLLNQQDDSDEKDDCFIFDATINTYCRRPPHNYPMIEMLLSLVHDCFFGMVMEAKCNQQYALLVGLGDEFIDSRELYYHESEYITMSVETDYSPLAYILNILDDACLIPSGYGTLDQIEPYKFINGIISICALPCIPDLMTNIFTKYNHELPDFFKVVVDDFTASIQKIWQVNGGTETNRITISNDGKEPDEYFNMDGVKSFQYYMETLKLPPS